MNVKTVKGLLPTVWPFLLRKEKCNHGTSHEKSLTQDGHFPSIYLLRAFRLGSLFYSYILFFKKVKESCIPYIFNLRKSLTSLGGLEASGKSIKILSRGTESHQLLNLLVSDTNSKLSQCLDPTATTGTANGFRWYQICILESLHWGPEIVA